MRVVNKDLIGVTSKPTPEKVLKVVYALAKLTSNFLFNNMRQSL